jgi:hypothetical protein
VKTGPAIDLVNLTRVLLVLLIAGVIIAILPLASVPPVDRDALTHHLFVPKLYLQHGGIYEIPEISFSYYPMNLELLYMIPLYFGNDIIPKYIHTLFALLTAGLIYRYLKKNLGTHYGLLGALFFLSIPIIIKLSITAYVDLGVVFFTTASLLLLLHWAETDFHTRFLVLSGLCCGLAAGTKYNGLISIFILTLFVPLIYQQSAAKGKQSDRKALLYGVLFAAAALTTFSPWLIRNYIWTGNPIYPLHNSFFQKVDGVEISKQVVEDSENTGSLQHRPSKSSNEFLVRKILYHEKWWQALLLPIRFFYEGRDDNPQFFDGKLSPFLLLLPILAFLLKSTHPQQCREEKFFRIFAILYFFLTIFQTSLRIRYIAPIIPPLVILSIYGLQRVFKVLLSHEKSTSVKKTLAFFLAACIPCIMLGYNAKYVFGQFAIVKPLPYLRGKINRDQYITAFRPEYPAIQYANTHLPPNTKVLCVFLGNRGYYMDFQPVFEVPVGNGLFSTFLDRNICGTDIIDGLQKKDITHVLMRDDQTVLWFQRLDNQNRTCIAPLLNIASTPLFSQNGYTFFQVKL